MKRILVIAVIILAVFATSCNDSGTLVGEWFINSSQSHISYDLDGVTGEAVFTYHSKSNNKILFTSGTALEGVEISFVDTTVKASRPDDNIEWEIEPELAETLSIFGDIYSYAAGQNYTSGYSDSDYNTNTKTFDYKDGSLEITFSKSDGRPVKIVYNYMETTIKLDIKEMVLL